MNGTQEIEQFFETQASSIQERYFAALDGLKANVEFSDQERLDRANVVRELSSRERAAALESRNAALEKREQDLRRRLFGAPVGYKDGVAVQSAAFTDALTRATLASGEDLQKLSEVAAQTGDQALGKAVFVAAEQRGMPDLALAYLNSNPDVSAAYGELASMPNAEERQAAAENPGFPPLKIEQVRPSFEDIQRAEHGKRMERIDAQDAYMNNS